MAYVRYSGDRFSCLSTENKPSDVVEGAVLIERDTKKWFMYVSGSWEETALPSGALTTSDLTQNSGTIPEVDQQASITGNWNFSTGSLEIDYFGQRGNFEAILSATQTWTMPNSTGTVTLDPSSGANYARNGNTWTEIDKAMIDALNVDADTLDGLNSTEFARNSQNEVITGDWTFTEGGSNLVTIDGNILSFQGLGSSATLALGGSNNLTIDGNDILTDSDVNSAAYVNYSETTVSLGGDFAFGESVKCVRIGNQVTISSDSPLSHSSDNQPMSSDGAIPALYRPTGNTFNVYQASDSSFDMVGFIAISSGFFITQYRDYAGNNYSKTTTGSGFTLTFTV